MRMPTRICLMVFFIGISSIYSQEGMNLIAILSGERQGDDMSIVSGVGDVNGDGFGDFVVGAPAGNYARLYFGGIPFDTTHYILLSPKACATFGYAVAGGGDLNGDGYSDFIVGAPYSSSGPPDYFTSCGKVFVYFGGPSLDESPDLTLVGQGWYYKFGHSLSFAGDVNKDGFDDIVIGAPMDDIDARGRAYIYFGGANMDSISDVYLEGQEGADTFGWSVSGCGDVNKDGYDDFLVGAPQRGAVIPIGKAYLVYGGSEINLNNSKVFVGDSTEYDYGRCVAGLGDINKDEFRDFSIMSVGYIRIISGKAFSIFFQMKGSSEKGGFVYISFCDDLNNDFFDDFIISTEKINGERKGGVFLFFGDSEIDSIPDIEFGGPVLPSCFGSSISFCRNLNGKNCLLIGDDQGDGWYGPPKVYVYSYDKGDKIDENKYSPKLNRIQLNQNYPNPFNHSTVVSFQITSSSLITIRIINCNGSLVKTIFSGQKDAGNYTLTWDGTDESNRPVSSGVYFAQMISMEREGSQYKNRITHKMVLIR